MRNVLKYLAAASFCCLALSFFLKDTLPGASDVKPALFSDPVQDRSESKPFTLHYDDKVYTIYPLFEYELHGMVVSQHESKSWLDWAHQDWDEFLNVKDLCVIWGDNLKNDLHRRLHYSSGDFTCFVKGSNADWKQFNISRLSNNHLLSSNPELTKNILSTNIGDQISLKGKLVQYKNNKGFSRGTSTSRADTGDGACETIFVEQFSIIERANPFWHTFFALSSGATAFFGISWLVLSLSSFFLPESLDPAHYMEQGDNMAARGKYHRAIQHYDKALKLDPSLAAGYRERGMCWEALGRFENAAQDQQEADKLELMQRAEHLL